MFEDHGKRAHDSSLFYKHTGTVADYLLNFCTIILIIPGMGLSGKWGTFVSEFESKFQFAAHIVNSTVFEKATKVTMREEVKYAGVTVNCKTYSFSQLSLVPINIESTGIHRTDRSKKRFKTSKTMLVSNFISTAVDRVSIISSLRKQ